MSVSSGFLISSSQNFRDLSITKCPIVIGFSAAIVYDGLPLAVLVSHRE
jgi:hypothetical protein